MVAPSWGTGNKGFRTTITSTPKILVSKVHANLNKTEAVEITKLLLDYQDIFAKNDLDIGGFNGNIKHKIDTGNANLVKQRRTPPHSDKEEEEHLKQMLKQNIIKESNSEWASKPVLVRQ